MRQSLAAVCDFASRQVTWPAARCVLSCLPRGARGTDALSFHAATLRRRRSRRADGRTRHPPTPHKAPPDVHPPQAAPYVPSPFRGSQRKPRTEKIARLTPLARSNCPFGHCVGCSVPRRPDPLGPLLARPARARLRPRRDRHAPTERSERLGKGAGISMWRWVNLRGWPLMHVRSILVPAGRGRYGA